MDALPRWAWVPLFWRRDESGDSQSGFRNKNETLPVLRLRTLSPFNDNATSPCSCQTTTNRHLDVAPYRSWAPSLACTHLCPRHLSTVHPSLGVTNPRTGHSLHARRHPPKPTRRSSRLAAVAAPSRGDSSSPSTVNAMASDLEFVKRMTPEGYVFPSHRLRRTCEKGRVPLVLVSCGSCEPRPRMSDSRARGLPLLTAGNSLARYLSAPAHVSHGSGPRSQ